MEFRTLLATTCLAALPALAQAADEPNILLIITDDMGLDASRCYSVGDQQPPPSATECSLWMASRHVGPNSENNRPSLLQDFPS